jgi:hypothetical protein
MVVVMPDFSTSSLLVEEEGHKGAFDPESAESWKP